MKYGLAYARPIFYDSQRFLVAKPSPAAGSPACATN